MMTLTPSEISAFLLSLRVGVCAVLAGLPLAVGLAYVLARYRFPGKWLIEVVCDLPLVLPPVVTGYLLLVVFTPRSGLGKLLKEQLGWQIVFTWWGAALAALVVSFPLLVRAIRLSFASQDQRLEWAARSLGASPWNCFWTVSLPLAWRGILAGSVLAFARSLGEFGATIMVAANIEGETQTLPLALFSLVNRPGGIEQAWRLVVLSIILAVAALLLSEALDRKVTTG